ncbi:MAG: capsular polysaccharide biosynthesis protein CapF [Oscillospiraceae bacterium]|nr:capsular polysaccharide biosynthesis protein CapF [Oscillospiraceae bacterium]
MKILITGADGFVGRNLCASLTGHELYRYDIDTDPPLLDSYCRDAEFVFHLAGVNRPEDPKEFMAGNFGFTSLLLETLKKYANTCPVVLSSSAQAALDNPYGRSKLAGEGLLYAYGEETGAKVIVYRFPNLFGKWCRPNYNSAVATFCHNIARGLPITVSDPKIELTLAYIDDVLDEFGRALNGAPAQAVTHKATLGRIVGLLESFRDSRGLLSLPDLSDPFTKKLHAAYLSYLPEDEFAYPLKMNIDERGSFTEILRTGHHGQFSVNITKPGIVKGNHWHYTKNEKFLVVSGKGVLRFRRIDDDKVVEYHISGDKMEIVDVPPGYTHNIENTGDADMIMFIWCNEQFDPQRPDTIYLEV